MNFCLIRDYVRPSARWAVLIVVTLPFAGCQEEAAQNH